VGGGDISIKDRLRRAPQRIALRWLVGRPGAMVMVHHDKTANAVAQIINRKHIAIVPYPVRPAIRIDVECRDSFRKQLGIGKTDKLILCYGATRYDKGADLAVAALARLPERFHLLVAGKQVYFRSDFLGRLAEDNGVADRMHVIPAMLSEADTALALHSCDMMLLPYRSEFPGGQSGPLTQAAAVGATLVAADLPVLTDTIKRYDLGMVFPPGNVEKMAAVLKEAADWRPSPESSDVFVSDHSPQSFARAVYESYLFRRAQAQNF
jgi:glycosyltransferase involved in cell wall biosynthesis